MKLIQCRYSSGQRVPLLVQTGAAHLHAIQAFYTYAETRGLDIDETILSCHFYAILALLDGYAIWLQSSRQTDNLVARIGKAVTVLFPQIDRVPVTSTCGGLLVAVFWPSSHGMCF
ncbi:hypothetical protein QMK47_15155 [Pseudomonas sp. P9_35]|uniref:hypothetical protein n=1 Tax=unclassified Pseudomonas TaxID=196821 RepID=UPI00215F8AA5|nr:MULTISPECIES: hypothetical protein [unclassified Pseudomonas]UVM58766.1 hypothetical protein LOY50_14430 [Pseudomonas sp. B21-010]WPN60893.1 hypothetical protein QMK48_14245 [Pseudomonas sp. P9_32]WPN66649.1 hypothetical protein QMK47_15155 [Pseudomonas sp. P9_35]